MNEPKDGTIEVAVLMDTASPKTIEEVRKFLEGNTAWGFLPKRSTSSVKEQSTVLVYEVNVS